MSKKKVSEVADPITLNSDRKWREVKILVRTSMHLIELERVASGIEWTRGLFHVIKFIWSVLSSDCRFSWLYFVLDFFWCVMNWDCGIFVFISHFALAQTHPESSLSLFHGIKWQPGCCVYFLWLWTEFELRIVPDSFLSRWQITLR